MGNSTIALQSVADIIAGISDDGELHGHYEYRVIQPACFSDFEPLNNLPRVRKAQPLLYEQLLHPGDILIKRLNPGITVLFDSKDKDIVASQNLFVIRIKDDAFFAPYIGYLMEQPTILAQFSQLSGSASAVRAISVKSLSKLEIPCLPLHKQHSIGKLWLLSKKRKELLESYVRQSEQLMAALYREIIR